MGSELNHPSIIKYVGFDDISKDIDLIKPVLLMEYICGGNLETLIKEKEDDILTDTIKLKLIIGIASGLSEFYKKGIIHRDLKPDNILINENFEPIICDLGCSRHCSETEYYTMTGKVGTSKFMAPEIFIDDLKLNYRYEVDSYSFGIILYQILTKKNDDEIYPKEGKLLSYKLVNYTPDLPDDMNEIFKYLITSCWNMSIDERPKPPMIFEILKEAINKSIPLLPNANLDEVKEYIKTLSNDKP